MKEEPTILIRLDGDGRVYRPGEKLGGEFVFNDLPENPGKTLEVSVLWFTEGKGEEDLAIHEFWRTDLDENFVNLLAPQHFSTTLPTSPLTYEGRIVKIRWCVRVRYFFQGGKEIFGQKIFRLGDVPPITVAPEAENTE